MIYIILSLSLSIYSLRRYNSSCSTLYAVPDHDWSLEVNGSRRWCYGWFALAMPWPTFAAWTSSWKNKCYDANMFDLQALIASQFAIHSGIMLQQTFKSSFQNFHKCLNVWLPRCSQIKGMVGDLISMCLPGLWDHWIWGHIGMSSLLTWVRKQNIMSIKN